MKPERSIGYEVKTLNNLIFRDLLSVSSRKGLDELTMMHGWIIGYLYKNQDRDVYQKDLETEFQITRSTVTSILKLMEKKGYIERVSVEKDARLKKLVLTEKAKKIQRQNFIDMHNTLEKQITRDISPEEMVVFRKVLHKMKRNLEDEKGVTA